MYMRLHFTDISFKLLRHRNENMLFCLAPTCLCASMNISCCAVSLLQNNILFWYWLPVFGLWHFVFLVMICLGFFLLLPPFPTASELSVLTLHRDERQCRVIVPGGHWGCFRSWFQKQSKNFLGFALEKKVLKILVTCVCAGLYKGRLGQRQGVTNRRETKRFWSSVFKWVKRNLEVLMAF